ncbi:MAG: radical SAM protein [Bacteroidales bacterium]|nr:radical SAM protein [Bacteroidales bacterium]
MIREFKSFLKTVGGGEGQKCHYPTRLDTFGRGCQHDCDYCYAKSLLDFRKMWDSSQPAVADIVKIEKAVARLPKGQIVRLGGMTDCFQPCEGFLRNTYKTIELLNEYCVGYLIVTKSDLVAADEYLRIMDKGLAHIQISLTTTSDELYQRLNYERAPSPSRRVDAIKKLQKAGFDVAVRLSPLIEEFIDFDTLNSLGLRKAVVEFLRVNSWIKSWFDIDYSKYTLKEGGYRHLPLEEKIRILNRIKIFDVSVCEDYTEHYDYWKNNFNPNPGDCCNLRVDNQ